MIKRCTRKTESGVIWLLAFLPRALARGFPARDSDEINFFLKKSCIAISHVVHVSMSSDVCETERVSSLGIHHLTIMEFSMWEKRLKNSNAFSVILDTDDADKLRSICKSTGMTQTAIIRCAVHNYLPYMEKIAEGLASAEADMASNHVQ